MTTNPKNKLIAPTISDIAHNFDFIVIAEGIETLEQYEFLVQNKCDYVQGFLFSKPVTSDEFEHLLRKVH